MFPTIVVYWFDTDVLLLSLAYHRHFEFEVSTCTVFCKIGMGPSSKIYKVSVNARAIGPSTCQALPFFHAFTGCDAASSFFNHSKKIMWEAWHKYPNHYSLTQIFKTLSGTHEQIYPFQLDEIGNSLKFVYYGKVSMESLDALRMNQFRCSTDNSLRTLPPSRDGLTEHIKRACLQDGSGWRTTVEDIDFTDATHWSWRFIDNKYVPKWHDYSDKVNVNYLNWVCSCKKDFTKIASMQKARSTACLTVGAIGNV